ncbi:replication-relaxation family protein [Salibacterium aidingense]|uniref:replication-relaxation family protein n=1 Tax=Salibacterium aidingense TaxID=384933 RepID=UPI0004113715|nr:replication-relaxation family protein [Salibacterium aidingense]
MGKSASTEDERYTMEIEKEESTHGRRTIDDVQILHDIYRFRALTPQQLRVLHFQGRKSYVYRKMQFLRKGGMVESKPLVRGGKKVESAYYITQKGIETLVRHEKVQEPRRWDRNLPDWRRIEDILDENELYVQLQGSGAEILEKRELKDALRMHRTSYVAAGLRMHGKLYHVYMFNSETTPKTMQVVRREIIQETELNRYILFFKGHQALERYKKMIKEEEGKLELMLIAYPYIPLRLGFLIQEPPIVKYFTKQYGVEPMLRSGEAVDTESTFADYEVELNGETFFIADMLWNDIMKYDSIVSYQQTGYERHKKRIIMVCWKEKINEYLHNVNSSIVTFEGIKEKDLTFHPFYPTYLQRIEDQDYRSPERRKQQAQK